MPQDLRHAIRQLFRAPGFAAIVIVTLALGIGANTAIFSVVDAVLLRPLTYRDADRLVVVYGSTREDQEVSPVPADFLALKTRSHTLEKVAGFREWNFNVRDGQRTEQVYGAVVSPDFFPLLDVAPRLGRTLVPDGEGHLAGSELIISEGYWRSKLHGATDVLGRTLVVDGRSLTVVGVMARQFAMPSGAQFWVPSPFRVPPHPLRPTEDPSALRSSNYFTTIARLAPGATAATARQEVFEILRDMAAPVADQEPVLGASLVPFRLNEVGDSRVALLILFGAAAVLLLIGCANLANLFLADATARQREWTVRLALGASRGRLVRERLVASLLLAGLGGLAGLLIAEWGVAILQAMAPTEIGAMIDPSPDIRVLGFTAAISLLTGIAFGVGPVLFSTQTDLAGGLRAGGKGAGDAPGRRRTRGILVVAEVSLALVLAIGAVLLGKTFTRVQGMQTGLDPDRLLTIGLVLPAASYPTTASRALFADRVLNQMKQVNGVTSASVVSRLALAPGSSTRSIALEGSNGSAGLSLEPDYLTAGPDYLRSMGITLQAGREFAANDRDGAPAVAMINQAMARKLWPSASAIGQRFRIDGDTAWREVVGVTADVRQRGFDRAPRPTFYVPFAQDPWTRLTVVVRARSSVVEIQRNAAAAIQRLDRDLAVSDIRPMTEVMAASLTERRFNLTLIGLFAGSALLLAIVGVYGVISYTVTQRTREVGIRMAIGAESRQIVAMIVRQGGGLAGAGILIGIAGSVLLTPVLRGMLFDITPTDLATYAEVSGVVMLVALAACYQPARRVTRVDPAIVLRSE